MTFKNILCLALLWAMANAAQAQCSFDPTVSGDSLLCPGESTTFTTQTYDSYQWYRRIYPDGSPEQIPGATQQSLAVDENGLLYYYWVEATQAGCTEASPEVLLDAYVFLLPYVIHTGDFAFDPDSQAFKICQGDTMFLNFNYEANVTWYKDGAPIPGETGLTLAITEPGTYTVEGAPGICPDFIQPLGLLIDVVVVNCTSPAKPAPVLPAIAVYPNPAGDWLTVENPADQPLQHLELVNVAGQIVRTFQASNAAVQQLSLANLPGGMYFLRMQRAGEVVVEKIIKD